MSQRASDTTALKPHSGFTLIELFVAITIATILVMLAAPSFKDMLMNNRILTQTDALVSALNYARNTALSQNTNVQVCPFSAANSTACGGNWQNGWIVVTQPAGGASALLQANDLGTNAPTLGSTVTNITFDARGITTTQANFTVCDTRGAAYGRSVEVLPTGFIQSSSTPGVAVWNGAGLTCL